MFLQRKKEEMKMAINKAFIAGTVSRVFLNDGGNREFLNVTICTEDQTKPRSDGTFPKAYIPVCLSGPIVDRLKEKVAEGKRVCVEGAFEPYRKDSKSATIYRVNASSFQLRDCGDFSHIVVQGRLTHDLEVRHTANGTPVISMNLAVDRSYQDKNGEWQNVASFITVTVWDKEAEALAKANYGIGKLLWITGKLLSRSYEKDGKKYYPVEIVAESVIDGGSGKYNVGKEKPTSKKNDNPDADQDFTYDGFSELDEELPFD